MAVGQPLDATQTGRTVTISRRKIVFNNQVNNVAYDLDRVVEANGVSNAANTHPMQDVNEPGQGFNQDRADRVVLVSPTRWQVLLDRRPLTSLPVTRGNCRDP